MTPLIIFDCDGVLVDTESKANERMAEIFTELGYPLTGPECRRKFQGQSMSTVCDEISGHIEQTLQPEAIQREINHALRSGVKAIEGVEKLVSTLIDAGIDVCVASSGTIEKMHTTLGQTSLLPQLEQVLFSSSQVSRGKPHPDVFLYAAEKMGYSPEHCIVIEDSLSGVQAGKAAGMKVLGYCGDDFTPQKTLSDAGAEIITSMEEVWRFAEELN
ncbi:HAD family hydrolase [Kiloniella sp.]|uniref:HAD family hydrolase n=1 Tax=Kiloniella sp. TaxID=1938587 RepID=UPI003B018070